MRFVRRLATESLCLLLAGALFSFPVTARAAAPTADAASALVKLGVPLDEARARLDALDDAELAELATGLDEQPAGAGDSDVAVAFIIVSAVVFITLVITDATGLTDIFPWVKKPGERRR